MIETSDSRQAGTPPGSITVAAIGDLHVTDQSEHKYRDLFVEISQKADVLALCGDLTNFGKTREAEILAEDLHACTIPTVAVLGNHDHECGQPEEVARVAVFLASDDAGYVTGQSINVCGGRRMN